VKDNQVVVGVELADDFEEVPGGVRSDNQHLGWVCSLEVLVDEQRVGNSVADCFRCDAVLEGRETTQHPHSNIVAQYEGRWPVMSTTEVIIC
jgi:hypothetical protein